MLTVAFVYRKLTFLFVQKQTFFVAIKKIPLSLYTLFLCCDCRFYRAATLRLTLYYR